MDNRDNEVVFLQLEDIIPNRFQPRQVFDEKALKELAVSIKEHGVIQPIIVRNIGNKYEIIAGERRYKASALAGLTKIPAIIRNLDDKESSKVALLENLQRKNLNPIEEAKTYQKILELDDLTQEELAKTMGKSQGAVANKIRLLSLTDEVQDALLKEQISERHARTLLNVTDKEEQKNILKEVINNKMTVRELEDRIKPKEKITVNDIEQLLNTEPISINEPIKQEVEALTPVQDNFNQNIGIDYSTPPKFIDYGIPSVDENLESTANKSIDINEIKEQAQDINIEAPKADMNSFLTVDTPEEAAPGDFKFFRPEPLEVKEEAAPLFETEQKPEDLLNNNDPFNLTNPTENINDHASTSMDSLLAGVENNKATVPPIDLFNNPFASNPIFQDNVEKQLEPVAPVEKYTLNESIDLIRNNIKKVEASGFKVDVEEMDFINNYQIVIKIAKENNE